MEATFYYFIRNWAFYNKFFDISLKSSKWRRRAFQLCLSFRKDPQQRWNTIIQNKLFLRPIANKCLCVISRLLSNSVFLWIIRFLYFRKVPCSNDNLEHYRQSCEWWPWIRVCCLVFRHYFWCYCCYWGMPINRYLVLIK